MKHDYARQYARFHPDTPEHEANLRALFGRWLGPHLPTDRNAAVLDVGCGRGYALDWLRGLGFNRLTGIDPDAGQVEFARRRDLPVTQVEETIAYLQANRARWDLILLMDVLEHIPLPQQATFLQAVQEALKPDGHLILTVPNADSVLAAHWRYADSTHHTVFTVYSLDFILHQADLQIETLTSVEFVVRPRFLFWLPSQRASRWWLLCLSRWWWRAVNIAELGWEQGRRLPLGPNLLAVARRRQ